MGDRWGAAEPPEDAYGRVADPQRFAPLHAIARDLLAALQQRFDATAQTSSELDPNGRTRAPVTRLIPSDPSSSPLAVTFTAFPGLIVRAGRTLRFPVPPCGCDACDETVDECARSLRECVDAVTAGTFGEQIVHRHGAWWHETWYRTGLGSSSGRTWLSATELAALREKLGSDDVRWAPWPPR